MASDSRPQHRDRDWETGDWETGTGRRVTWQTGTGGNTGDWTGPPRVHEGMRIFFTGGSGKAGRHVAPHLAEQGHQVTNADLVPLGHPASPTSRST